MRNILPILIFSLLLIMPSGTTFGAETGDCKILKDVFGEKVVKHLDQVCRVTISRKDLSVSMMGLKLSPHMMDLQFGANFEKVGNKTAVMGEFALLNEEVNPVIDALRKGNIEVSAIHNHMIGEQPRIIYLHFQGTGDLESVAKTVKSAISTVLTHGH